MNLALPRRSVSQMFMYTSGHKCGWASWSMTTPSQASQSCTSNPPPQRRSQVSLVGGGGLTEFQGGGADRIPGGGE